MTTTLWTVPKTVSTAQKRLPDPLNRNFLLSLVGFLSDTDPAVLRE